MPSALRKLMETYPLELLVLHRLQGVLRVLLLFGPSRLRHLRAHLSLISRNCEVSNSSQFHLWNKLTRSRDRFKMDIISQIPHVLVHPVICQRAVTCGNCSSLSCGCHSCLPSERREDHILRPCATWDLDISDFNLFR